MRKVWRFALGNGCGCVLATTASAGFVGSLRQVGVVGVQKDDGVGLFDDVADDGGADGDQAESHGAHLKNESGGEGAAAAAGVEENSVPGFGGDVGIGEEEWAFGIETGAQFVGRNGDGPGGEHLGEFGSSVNSSSVGCSNGLMGCFHLSLGR